jgi:hypothetical protein
MNNYRKTAIIVGILYVIGTVAGVLSVILTGPILGTSDFLARVAANPNQLLIGALLVLLMGLALSMVPALLFPIFRKIDEVLAAGYLIFRGALETVACISSVSLWLFLVVLGRQYLTTGVSDAALFQTLGAILRDGGDALNPIATFVFSLGALMLYTMLYRSQLIPRWISIWGFIAIVLHIARGFLVMFNLMSTFSAIDTIVNLPIALQEMVMAVWFIAKGFSPAALASLSAKTARNGLLSAS